MARTSMEASPAAVDHDGATTAVHPGAAGRARRTAIVPQVADIVFIAIAALVPTVYYNRLMFSDGDMLRHVRLGEYMLQHHALLTHDVFSFTRGGAPFTPYEWLSEIVFGALHHVGGLAAVALASAAIIATAYALVFKWLLRRGVGHWTAVGGIAYAIALGNVHWLARPHIFSFLGCAILLWVLESRLKRPLLTGILLFAVWVNLHPGAFLGLTLLAAMAAGEAVEPRLGGERMWPGRTREIGLLLLGGFIGLFLTPQGPHLVLHALNTLHDSFLMDNTEEFLSPNFHLYWGKAFMAGVLGLAALFAFKRERPPLAALAVFLLLAASAAVYQRDIPFFGLVAAPLLLAWPDLHRSVPAIQRLARTLRHGDELAMTGVWSGVFALGMAGLAITGGRVGPLQLVRNDVSPRLMPVAAVDYARAHHVSGPIFHEQIWGGYMIYAWPEEKVYIDGATDFYGPELSREYMNIMGLSDGWEQKLAARHIHLALLPAKVPLAEVLQHYAGWQPLYSDSVAVLLQQPEDSAARTP